MNARIALLFLALAFANGCGSSVSKTNTDAKTERTFAYPLSAVQAAAREAIVANGFEVTGEEAGFVTGHRPNQVGLFVGSGGENIGVWYTSPSPSQTKVQVVTKLTAAGIVGQKTWDDEVLKSIEEKLKASGK